MRAFDNPMLLQEADPARDIRAFDDELILTDLVQIENRIQRLKKEKDKDARGRVDERLKDSARRRTPSARR